MRLTVAALALSSAAAGPAWAQVVDPGDTITRVKIVRLYEPPTQPLRGPQMVRLGAMVLLEADEDAEPLAGPTWGFDPQPLAFLYGGKYGVRALLRRGVRYRVEVLFPNGVWARTFIELPELPRRED